MTQEELNSLIKNQYESMGIPSSTADKLLSNERVPAYVSHPSDEPHEPTMADKAFSPIKGASFSLQEPKSKEANRTSISNAAAMTRAKKEDLLLVLRSCLEQEEELVDASSIQDGKAGAIMFKNTAGEYFTLKLTLNKSKPADYVE